MIAPPVIDVAYAIKDPVLSSTTVIIVSQTEIPDTTVIPAGSFLEILDPMHPDHKQRLTIASPLEDTGNGNTKINLSNSMSVTLPYKGSTGKLRILGAESVTQSADLNDTSFYIDDASLFPDTPQNPIYVTLANGLANEDLIELIAIDKETNKLHINPAGESLQSLYTVGTTVHLNVKYIALKSSGVGWPTKDGAIYLEYGFTGNSTVIAPIEITGTATGGTASTLVDESKDFMGYGNPYALIGATVHITDDNLIGVLGGQSKIVTDVLHNELYLDSDFINPFTGLSVPVTAETYKVVNKYVELDNDDDGCDIDRVGGILKPIESSAIGQTSHPARDGGIKQEYIRYKTRVGNVLELEDYKVFKHARPSGSQVFLASGYHSNNKYGKDHRPYLNGNLLDIIFDENLSPFGGIISAAGVKPKTEVSEVGKNDA